MNFPITETDERILTCPSKYQPHLFSFGCIALIPGQKSYNELAALCPRVGMKPLTLASNEEFDELAAAENELNYCTFQFSCLLNLFYTVRLHNY